MHKHKRLCVQARQQREIIDVSLVDQSGKRFVEHGRSNKAPTATMEVIVIDKCEYCRPHAVVISLLTFVYQHRCFHSPEDGL